MAEYRKMWNNDKIFIKADGDMEGALGKVQRESHKWRQKAYPTTSTPELQTLGMAEEVGEVAHAVLKNVQGIRGYDLEKTKAEVGDGLADVIIYACGIASAFGLDLEDELLKAWTHVRDRNITEGSMGNGNEPVQVDDEKEKEPYVTQFQDGVEVYKAKSAEDFAKHLGIGMPVTD